MTRPQKLVIRDIWSYAATLFGIAAVAGLVLTGSLGLLWIVGAICVMGATILTLDTLARWQAAARRGEPPDTTRIWSR